MHTVPRSLKAAHADINPHFHFETLPPDLWIIAIINIHAAVKAMKTIQMSVPDG
jgi:hypothetical protein